MNNRGNNPDKPAHGKFMREALRQAKKATESGDVPIGAVIVLEGKIIARGRNMVEKNSDPTAHAEMIAIRKAVKKIGYKHLLDCSLYVTLEPCPMCAGAIVSARIREVHFATADPKAGACGSVLNVCDCSKLNHRSNITSGTFADEASAMLKEFFAFLRSRPKKKNL